MQAILTKGAPAPAGHYSQAIVHGGFVFVAGQLPLHPVSGVLIGEGDIEAQTHQTLRNVEAILREAGSSLERLLSVTIYITSLSQWAAVNTVYGELMGTHRPARAVVPVPELRPGCQIEIQAIAAVP